MEQEEYKTSSLEDLNKDPDSENSRGSRASAISLGQASDNSATENSEAGPHQLLQYDSSDLPLCSICDSVSLECLPLPYCPHPACPECLARACHASGNATTKCKLCVEQDLQHSTNESSGQTADSSLYSGIDSLTSVGSGMVHSEPASSSQSEPTVLGLEETVSPLVKTSGDKTDGPLLKTKQWVSFSSNEPDSFFPPDHNSEVKSHNLAKKDLKIEIVFPEKVETHKKESTESVAQSDKFLQMALTPVQAFDQKKRDVANTVGHTLGEGVERQPSISTATEIRKGSISKTDDTQNKQSLSDATKYGAKAMDICEGSLSDRVRNIQRTFAEATRYSHCYECLCTKKSVAPDVVCLDCAVSLCNRCYSRHRSITKNLEHIVVPVAEPSKNVPRLGTGFCLSHGGIQLTHYCQNCEQLVCSECIAFQHLDCPGITLAQEFATEEREAVRKCRVKYAQVMRFFSEQRRDTEEAIAALDMKKKTVLSNIRSFFSALIKSCMDVEGSLLENLETAVSDQTDLLKEQSSSWLSLQEVTQQLLDLTDILSFLPTADFLPLSASSKFLLSQSLRQGEELAATAPPQMMLSICLEQSSQRGVIKRIKEIGATALTVTTHNTLSLRMIDSVPFFDASDKEEPLITSMLLLSPWTLLAVDFNNSCLKLLHKDQDGEDWNIVQVFPLKFRPYGLAKLDEKSRPLLDNAQDEVLQSKTDLCSKENDEKFVDDNHPDNAPLEADTQEMHQRVGVKMTIQQRSASLGRQTAVTLDEEELPSLNTNSDSFVDVAVSSPFAGCVIISVPVSGPNIMSVKSIITKDKGCWGITRLDEQVLAVCGAEAGKAYINLINTKTEEKQRLKITSEALLMPLVSPRQMVATSHTSVALSDHGRKAVLHMNISGNILFTYTGHSSQKLSRPEGLCMDGQGHIYIADSGDHSVSIIAKGGHLLSKTGSQQSDLQCPQALCVDKNSCLYVSNNGGKMLTIFDIIHES